jgi:membrane protease YdiL (CAAX protease family)
MPSKRSKKQKRKTWIDAKAERLLKPFRKDISLGRILKNWLVFVVAGVLVMSTVQMFAKYDMSEADTLTSESGEGCDLMPMLLLLVLPPIEELLFRILPHRYFGNGGALLGTLVWAMLHLLGRNLAIVAFQLVVGMFYYKMVTASKYKEVIVLHEAFNLLPLASCLFF